MTFRLPPYPYDRLAGLAEVAGAHEGGMVDCSIGTPCDPPPPEVLRAMATSDSERGYPTSPGSPAYRRAAAEWMARRFGVAVDPVRGRLWITCTAANRLVELSLTRPLPRVVGQWPTVRQPNTVAVDPRTDTVFVVGVYPGHLQIVRGAGR